MARRAEVTNDFKSAFALLLTILKVNYTVSTALNYSETLYEWTLGALVTEGKIVITYEKNAKGERIQKFKDTDPSKNLAEAFDYASEIYLEAVQRNSIQAVGGRKEWIQSEILDRCFKLNRTIFPIALSEGILDLKDIAAGIGMNAESVNARKE